MGFSPKYSTADSYASCRQRHPDPGGWGQAASLRCPLPPSSLSHLSILLRIPPSSPTGATSRPGPSPMGQKCEQRVPQGVSMQEWGQPILPHDPTLPPAPTLAVLLSACSFSITSELTLRKSLSTGLSSCRMNSLRVSSIPCCRLRTSCSTLSRETAGRAGSTGVRAGLESPHTGAAP